MTSSSRMELYGTFHVRWNTANKDNDMAKAWRLIPVKDGVEQAEHLVSNVSIGQDATSWFETATFLLDGVVKGNIKIVGAVEITLQTRHCTVL